MANIEKRSNGVWRARYYDDAGKQHARHFPRKVDAKAWLDTVTASVVRGDYTDPKTARTTVAQWCATWLEGYATRRASTVRQARVHVAQINRAFGSMRLADVRPSQVKAWTAKLKAEGYADSTVYATYRRFAQIMGDAGQGRHHSAVTLQPEDFAGRGSAAALRGHHRAGLGTA